MDLGFGMAAIGRPQYINIKQQQQQQQPVDLRSFRRKGLEVLNYAYKAGISYFDTAPGYGFAEELLMEWIASLEDPQLEIATKWGYTYTANFDPRARQHEVKEHSIDKLNQQWEYSKKLLPHLSTYQIHSATLESGVLGNLPVLHRMAELKQQYGLKIGLTTSGEHQLEIIRKALEIEVEGDTLFDVFQVTYNILEQDVAAIFDSQSARNKRFIIKEALANGRIFPNKHYVNYKPLYNQLIKLAKKYHTGIDAIALRFCIDSLNPFLVLSGASEVQHLQENMETAGFKLTHGELQSLNQFRVSSAKYWNERKGLTWN